MAELLKIGLDQDTILSAWHSTAATPSQWPRLLNTAPLC
jgi:hypothetical protein